MDTNNTLQRRVVCAAIKLPNGTIVCGARHFDKVMQSVLDAMGGARNPKVGAIRAEQGFIDQFGVFMDREEALIVAKAADQIIRDLGYDNPKLYSECLY